MKLLDPNALKLWYDLYYGANAMTLAVLGKESLEELADMVENICGPIPFKKTAEPLEIDGKVFPASLQGKKVWIEPLKDLKQLTLTWEIPYEYIDLDTKTARLLSHGK